MFKDHAMKISCIALTKIMENLEKKTDNFPQFSQNENIFVKIHFDKNILILRKLGGVVCLLLKIFP